MKLTTFIIWALRLLAALIMLQTLYFKFSGHEQSIKLFTQLGMEPWGRIGIGCMELIASVLLLIPRTTPIGALMAAGISAGALFFHLTKLGIEVQNDGGVLFILACIVFLTSGILLILYRKVFTDLITQILKRVPVHS